MSEPRTPDRRRTLAGRLARLGFTDAGRAGRLLDGSGAALGDEVLEALGAAPDPDLALDGLLRLLAAADEQDAGERPAGAGGPGDARERDVGAGLRAMLADDPGTRERLLAVLGVSAALGDHLARHPAHWQVLRPADPIHPAGPDAPGPDAPARDASARDSPAPTPPAPDDHVVDAYESRGRPSAAELRVDLLRAVGADPARDEPVARDALPVTLVALRVAYRRRLLALAGRDLTGAAEVEEVAGELADLAAAALEAGLAIARAEVPGHGSCRLAVIGMGKCGGRELNYVSDVDVIFVAEVRAGCPEDGALRTATRLASAMMRACSDSTVEGPLWEVDAALRPEGRSGPLVRTLASHRAYYERWAKTWEFQALLKARPVAGDAELGRRYLDAVTEIVWDAAEGERFVEDVQAMRRRVEADLNQRTAEAERQLKLGPGGLRDVEFAVQLLQLVHGRGDEKLRSPTTLDALAALSQGGYVGRDDAAALASAYRFLRRVEHLIQLHRLRRTHVVPDDPADLRRLGRALGLRTDPVGEFTALWRRHAREVRRIHEKLFYRPLLRAVARLPGDEARLTPEAARARLEALGYDDPAGALRHIEALTAGVSRRAAIQRTLLPVMLGWFADAPDPDAGLLGFRRVSEALGATPWYLRLLRDEVTVAERMAWILGSSRYATDLLLRAPEAVAMLGGALNPGSAPRPRGGPGTPPSGAGGDSAGMPPAPLFPPVPPAEPVFPAPEPPPGPPAPPAPVPGLTVVPVSPAPTSSIRGPDGALAPRPFEALRTEALAAVRRRDDSGAGDGAVPAEDAVAVVRALRRRELFRVSVADLLGMVDVATVGEALTDIATVTLEAALRAAAGKVERAGGAPLPTRMAVVAMGRFGGHELGYGSDADVMFVHDPLPGADEREASRAAHAVAEELRRLLSLPAPDPPLEIDPNLRPEGRQGPLVRTLASYAAYYARWSEPWEAQALLRADPMIGDPGLCERFRALIDPLRWPEDGIGDDAVRQIRRLKARMESERLPRGVERRLHIKLGPGGLADVEWVAQLFQLRHAHEVPALRTTRTLAALDAAVGARLLAAGDAEVLADAWRLATRIRGSIMLVRGRASDLLPTDHHRERSSTTRILGYPGTGDLLEDYRRHARHARAVVDRVFYGAAD
ncbi:MULTISPECIES: bifunctional [glutamine synthetase] adenylyltransferase/[glutamine synthetase]-adenylyl-L-tyrosine phosphorylase [Thermomonosporaceae]|uniref:bifunctional [glutamine synthetase] adenylyltransferase/[glutamine synthetase]-adenylyl-L-tyrosine phosphorylase n=1 Tax=Thermomonosporaceae TaxID=2012 RepID=UPI00255B3E93|nr:MULTISPECIES: bifunctional [glutamine synthetase] adenylyltransferase/[glutamine synthetase]-adenylyl-L-tyrosine phosphorylase [Thermomonosporaceae]MDL4771245.1 bifunctional [glutamine synthetase] adenylyltransferase/[glutamine synthetase]-adenylyl-L-tyrosine phosphorylase [Actinomadura xylanilytica]